MNKPLQQKGGGFFLHFGVAGARGGQFGKTLLRLLQAVVQFLEAMPTVVGRLGQREFTGKPQAG